MRARRPETEPAEDQDLHHVEVHLDRILAERVMTLAELSEQAGVTVANLAVLKNGRARAVRFSTLTALCHVLDCQPGDLLTVAAPPDPTPTHLSREKSRRSPRRPLP